MKGYVSVSAQAILEMAETCICEIHADYNRLITKTVNSYIETEINRVTTRKWYRLFILPKPRFSYCRESVEEFSTNEDYALFDGGCPFKALKADLENSVKWVNKLISMAKSQYVGAPILLSANIFNRISNPKAYGWVSTNGFFYTVNL